AVPGCYVRLKVTDTGCGMSDEIQAKLFEPFFTTKEPGKGTGLGLATAYGILKQSGGFVKATSKVGHGTTFEVYLPRTEEPAKVLPFHTDSTPTVNKGSRILLVEDEFEVRKLVCSLLERDGHEVTQAENGAKAVDIIRRCMAPFDL